MTSRRRRRALSLEELELWLASDQAPAKGGWNVSAVDGLIAGIVIGPAPIEPEEWTRLIFGARPLGPDGEAALQAVLDRHDAVAKILAKVPASYAPLFMRTDEGLVLAQDWTAGFLAAIRLRLQAWRPPARDGRLPRRDPAAARGLAAAARGPRDQPPAPADPGPRPGPRH